MTDDDAPDDVDNMMLLSPEQYEFLRKAYEEGCYDGSREQAEALLRRLSDTW